MDPDGLDALATYEAAFGKTIKRKESIATVADNGTPYEAANDTDLAALAMGTTYDLEILLGSNWFLPAGAFGESSGPM